MKILLDECLLVKLKDEYSEFLSFTVKDKNWIGIKNGELLKKAAEDNFDVFVTADKKLIFQINRDKLNIGIVILESKKNDLLTLKTLTKNVKEVFNSISKKQIVRIKKSGIQVV
jgi:predicted nuclease of predicted toxin-antitoxin system